MPYVNYSYVLCFRNYLEFVSRTASALLLLSAAHQVLCPSALPFLSPSCLATTETMQMEALPAGLLLCCRGPWIPVVGGTLLANRSPTLVTYAPLIGHSPAYLPCWDRPYMPKLPVCYFTCFIVRTLTNMFPRKPSRVNILLVNRSNLNLEENNE